MYTEKQLKDIWDMCVEYEVRIDKISGWLECLIDWYAIIDLPHPADILNIIDDKFMDILSYILWECSENDFFEIQYPDWRKIKVKKDFESLLLYCKEEWLLTTNNKKWKN